MQPTIDNTIFYRNFNNIAVFYIFGFVFIIIIIIRKLERESNHASASSFPKCPQQLGQKQAEVRAKSSLGLPHGGRDPSTSAGTRSLSGGV